MELQPGTMVTPNVRLERPLGKGAMGEVWVAEHLGLQTQVAVKFVSDRLDPDSPEVLERFTREAAAAAQIKSAHVVQKFDHGVMRSGTPYIVMEYLEGERLDELLARRKRLELPEVAKVVWQTAKALQSAHKLGIVHRDIKPDNIFLSLRDDEPHVKVFDFGVAKQVQLPASDGGGGVESPELGITNDGVMIGTPEYMSPEQVMDARSVDHFADLWALGVVAYVSLTGRLPFVAEDVGKLCVRLLEADYQPPSRVCPDLPAELDGWFAKVFAKSRAARFQSARELAQALMQVPGAQPHGAVVSGPHPTPSGRGLLLSDPMEVDSAPGRSPTLSGSSAAAEIALVPRQRRRNSLIAALAVGTLGLGLGVLVLLQSGGDNGAPAAPAPTLAVEAATAQAESLPEPPTTPTASPSASASAAATSSTGQPAPRPTASPRWAPPRPKDPGF